MELKPAQLAQMTAWQLQLQTLMAVASTNQRILADTFGNSFESHSRRGREAAQIQVAV